MTYCVGLRLNRGLVFMSDTRTNAGVDAISTFRKMFTYEKPGERAIVLLTAGNLATTQSVISLLDERLKVPEERNPSILEASTMFQVARLVGKTLKEAIQLHVEEGQAADNPFKSTIILGGQIAGSEPRLFLVYPEGNFIEAADETPFFQIGETKYGKPILVRAYDPDMTYEQAVKLLMVSFDSTIKSNLSVGMPLDLQILEKDACRLGTSMRIEADNPYYLTVSNGWGDALQTALHNLPNFTFEES